MKNYNIILTDPPWSYGDKSKNRGGAIRHYPTLTDAEILGMDIPATDNALMFMWATFPRLELALQCFKAWGFVYKTQAFTWIKTNKDGSPAMCMGRYTRANAEVCLLGVRGRGIDYVINKGVNSAVIAPRLRHSQKPTEVYERIEKLVGDEPSKLEMFARNTREGWDSWGNEV
jgi:N6-adenosine-specific RNA methylase IME4